MYFLSGIFDSKFGRRRRRAEPSKPLFARVLVWLNKRPEIQISIAKFCILLVSFCMLSGVPQLGSADEAEATTAGKTYWHTTVITMKRQLMLRPLIITGAAIRSHPILSTHTSLECQSRR